jgi:hypothetical protein
MNRMKQRSSLKDTNQVAEVLQATSKHLKNSGEPFLGLETKIPEGDVCGAKT